MQKKPLLTDHTCKEITDLILSYLNDQMSANTKRKFQRHLKLCPDCVNFLNTYRTTMSQTQQVSVASMPAKVQANLLAYLQQKLRKLAALALFLVNQIVT